MEVSEITIWLFALGFFLGLTMKIIWKKGGE